MRDKATFSVEELQTKALKNCNYIRVIVMTIIVFNHCMNVYSLPGWTPIDIKAQSPEIFTYIRIWFSSFMNSTFVIVSGYVYRAMKFEKGKYQDYASFAVNKVKRLIVPTVFICAVWIIPVCIYAFGFGTKEIVNNFVLGVAPRQMWFMLMLFWVFIIYAPISKIAEKNTFLGLIMVGILYLAGTFGIKFVGGVNYFQIFTGLKYVIYFWIGASLRKHGIGFLMKIPCVVYIAVNVLLLAAQNYVNSLKLPHLVDTGLNVVMPILVFTSGGLMAFIVLQKIFTNFGGGTEFYPSYQNIHCRYLCSTKSLFTLQSNGMRGI